MTSFEEMLGCWVCRVWMAELFELQLLPKRELFRVANLLSLIRFFPYHQGSDIREVLSCVLSVELECCEVG